MRAIQEPKGLPLRLPFAPDKNFNYVYDLRIRNVTSDAYNSRAEVELTEDNFPFDKALADGTDIAFRDDKGVTLNHSIVNWGNGSAKVNVALDDIYNRDLRSLQMFYGKLPFPIPLPGPSPLRWTAVVRAPYHAGQASIRSLVGHNSKLYGTTSGLGMLFEWNDVDAWVTKAPYLKYGRIIVDSVVFNSKIYGGNDDGELVEWNGVDAWVEKAPAAAIVYQVNSLGVMGGDLYGSMTYNGSLYEWNDSDAWIFRGSPGLDWGLNSLTPFNGNLYGAGKYQGHLFEFGPAKVLTIKSGSVYRGMSHLIVFRNRLYGISKYNSYLYQWNGTDAWIGSLAKMVGTHSYLGAVVVYNDELIFAANDGKLYAWNNLNAWIAVAYVPTGETYVRSLYVYDGRLFGGTYPHGQLVEYIAT